jgi:hypothetical protein
MALTEGQWPVGACCFYETPRNQGREFGVGAEELHGVGPRRRLVAYRKHIKRQPAKIDSVCAMIPERRNCVRLDLGVDWESRLGWRARPKVPLSSRSKARLEPPIR